MNPIIEYVRKNFIPQKDSNLEYIVYSGSRGEKGFIKLIFYSNGHPILVGKVARDKAGIGLKNEYSSLKILQKILKNSNLIKTIETPFSFINLDNNFVLFKDYKEGIRGDKYISNNKFNRQRMKKALILLHASTDWLIKFLTETREYHINSKEEKTKLAYELINGGNLPLYLKYWVDRDKFFLAPSHGDLTLSNILMKDLEVSCVLDFENFTLKGFPLADLIGIIVDAGAILYGTNQQMINNTFFELNPFSQEVYRCILKFCEVFRIDIKDFIRVMPIYTDRAISICAKWNMNPDFHIKLKYELIKRYDELLRTIKMIHR